MWYLLDYSVVFSPFFFSNRDKHQSPFFAECDKSAQPITAHHATNCSLASYSHLKISSSTLYFVIKKQTKLGLRDKSHVIAMHISAVKPVLWSPSRAFRWGDIQFQYEKQIFTQINPNGFIAFWNQTLHIINQYYYIFFFFFFITFFIQIVIFYTINTFKKIDIRCILDIFITIQDIM